MSGYTSDPRIRWTELLPWVAAIAFFFAMPEYLREVKKVNGQLANVEIETLGTAVKDPWKELQKKK